MLYDDRVKSWHAMQHFDFLLDTQEPTAEICGAMVEADIRNRQADDELIYYQEHKAFLGIHPLVIARENEQKLYKELYDLQKNEPDKLVEAIVNNEQNIRRIKSNIDKQKFKDAEEKEKWHKNLKRAELRKKVIAELIGRKNAE